MHPFKYILIDRYVSFCIFCKEKPPSSPKAVLPEGFLGRRTRRCDHRPLLPGTTPAASDPVSCPDVVLAPPTYFSHRSLRYHLKTEVRSGCYSPCSDFSVIRLMAKDFGNSVLFRNAL